MRLSSKAGAPLQRYSSSSWQLDETHVKVDGRWKYLFWAVDKHGMPIDLRSWSVETHVHHTVS